MNLKRLIENNHAIYFLVILSTGFSAGYGANEAIRKTAGIICLSKSEIAIMENERKGMKTKIVDLNKLLDSKELKESDYKKQIKDLTLKVDNLTNENNALNQKITNVSEEAKKAEKELIAKYNSEIENLKRKGASNDTTSKNCEKQLSDGDIRNVQSSLASYLNNLKRVPAGAAALSKQLKVYVDKFESQPCYEKRIPVSVSMIYRLYAASFLFSPTGSERSTIEESLIWLRKSIKLNKNYEDIKELKAAETFFTDLTIIYIFASVNLESFLKHSFRVAMIDASQDEVQAEVDYHLPIIKRKAEN